MSFDYFYGQQSDLFTFYRVPKVLFTNERFWNISADAKMLYGILLDRMSLSAKNGWIDKNGRVYYDHEVKRGGTGKGGVMYGEKTYTTPFYRR